jgi:phosphate transport system protein
MHQEDRVGRHFTEELEALKGRLLEMGQLAAARVERAMHGLIARDASALEEVINGDQAVNEYQLEIDDRCFKLLALRQPVASDLRFIVAAAKITGDLERIGDLAVNVAEAARRYIQHPPVKPLIDLPRMSELAQQMLHDALEAFVSGNVAQTEEILRRDDILDELKNQVFRELLTYMLGGPDIVAPALDLVLISRHLERVGDHATNIAEDAIFSVEGKDVRHHAGNWTT